MATSACSCCAKRTTAKQGHREIAASLFAEAMGDMLIPATGQVTHGGRAGSAMDFKEGMIDGDVAGRPPNNIPVEPHSLTPTHFAPGVDGDSLLERFQLMDDLLLHGDRHGGNFMVALDAQNRVTDIRQTDNGLSLPANTGVVRKWFPGPKEGKRISPENMERLRRLIAQQTELEGRLKAYLEPEAIAGVFARAKALLARGTYGNFTLNEVNAYLPAEMRAEREIEPHDISN